MKFDVSGFMTNKDLYPCKRLCAINGSEFAVSMKRHKGYVKIYNVEQTDPKKSVLIEAGAYGICRVNNYLFVGSLDNTIKYINLDDEDQQVETSRQLTEVFNTSFFELKKIKHSVDRP
jgi:WD40 repeat protein